MRPAGQQGVNKNRKETELPGKMRIGSLREKCKDNLVSMKMGYWKPWNKPTADAPEIIQNAWEKGKSRIKLKNSAKKQELSYEDKIARQSLIAKKNFTTKCKKEAVDAM